jgi:hypothetical protein
MRTTIFTRDFYIPKGATKVADKGSDAVAYVYSTTADRCGAAVFFGKQAKPVVHETFRTPERREQRVRELFASRCRGNAFRVAQRQERKAAGRGLELGDILTSSWGYDQTQVDAFQVTALIGSTMVELRAIGLETVPGSEGHDCDRVTPIKDAFLTGRFAETHRKVAQGGHVTIDRTRGASKWTGGSLHRSWYR